MKNNIYDLISSELILRTGASSTSAVGAPALTITNSTGSNDVPENYNGSMEFTSTLTNIPAGYTVVASSHVITYPTAVPTTVGSTDTLIGPLTSVILGVVGSVFTVTSAVTIEHATDPDVTITGTSTITSVLPIFYGVKAYESSPTSAGLSEIASTAVQFTLTTSIVGRLFVAIPTSITAPLVFLTGPNGLIFTIANDFTLITAGSYDFYQLNHDTQLTGTNAKTFTINY